MTSTLPEIPMSQDKNNKPTPDELRRQLGYLNLPFMRDHCEELLGQAAEHQWSHPDFFRRLVEGETAARQDRARQRRIRNARFPVLKTLDQFDFTWPTKINRLAVQDLFRLKFIEDKANVVIVGTVGLGKSHLCIALGHAAATAGFTVRFTTAIDIVNTLAAAQSTHRLKAELKKYINPDLVLIDELGYLPIDKIGADLLFQVFSQRYETGLTIVTTNQPYKNWPKIFNNDSTLTSAVLDRLLHHAETVIVEGRSYRMKDQIETP